MGLSHKIWRSGQLVRGNGAFLRNYLRGARLSGPPIFILGCGHSGTSLLLKVLDMHSQVYGVPYESRLLFKDPLRIRLLNLLWAKAAIAEGKGCWAEKTPMHILRIGRVFELYPEARVLLVIRDGRDVALSLRKRWHDFDRAVERWIADNREGERWWDHPQVHRVRYEEMVADFEPTLRRVCGFLQLPYEEGLADFHRKPAYFFSRQLEKPSSEAGEDHKHFRNWQINQRLFDGSGKWVAGLTAEEKALFKARAGRMLIDYGYAADLDW